MVGGRDAEEQKPEATRDRLDGFMVIQASSPLAEKIELSPSSIPSFSGVAFSRMMV
jgi:hypothetical protein